jgi:hypothetical protein
MEDSVAMAQGFMDSETPVAVINGPKGTAEIFESIATAAQALEYQVKFKDETRTFNNLGEAYLTAGELTGTQT